MLIVPRFAGKNGLDADRTADLASMAKSADVRMIRYAGRATVDWRWTRDSHERELTDAGVHLHHIHGEGDHTIPLVREHADEIVAGGHHLLTWTNPVEVNAAIERELLGRRKSNPCAAAPDAPVRTG
jgi:pimeloyl-ACP methyl ester carboxylesterase